MYANLAVCIAEHGSDQYETVYAYGVKIIGARVTVLLDGQDGSGSYSEPAGERTVDLLTHHVYVSADF